MSSPSLLRVESVKTLTDSVLSCLDSLSEARPSYSKSSVSRDIHLSSPLLDDGIHDLIDQTVLQSMEEMSLLLAISIPQKFTNDTHILNTCSVLLRHRKTILNTSLLYFVIGILMSKTKLFMKTIRYFQKSLQMKVDLYKLYEQKYYPPSEVLSRKVQCISI